MRLLEPLRVGPLTLRNRVVMGAMHTRIDTLDRPIERLAEFYRVRAAGEVGLILTGGIAPSAEGRVDPGSAVLATPADIERQGHRAICEAVHAEGGAIAMQILHAGRYALVPEPVGPSSQRSRISPLAPRPLATHEVWDIVTQYVNCARLACAAGYDGVEIMGSEGYLLNEFTSPCTNDRADEFGGGREGRFRLPVEIVRQVRAAVGRDFLLIYRISVIDLVPDGLTADEVVDLARRIEAAGADMLNTGIGWHESRVPTIAASVPRAAWAFAVSRVKQAVSIPVIASNRINTPEVAEELLAGGDADLVSMARPLLADPAFVAKLRAGRPELICTCIGCNQACLDAVFGGRVASCMVNPRACHELEFPAVKAAVGKRVAVIGAGPAGLACAVTAAERGHRVTLFDAAPAIGGLFQLARRIPGKGEFAEAIRYYRARLRELAVDVRLSHRVSASELASAGYDELVIATGARPRVPAIVGIEHPSVVPYEDLLSGRVVAGARVAIIGAGGIGFDVAEFLLGDPLDATSVPTFLDAWAVDPSINEPGGLRAHASTTTRTRKREVTLMQRSEGKLGRTLGRTTGWILLARLRQAGLREIAGATYERIDDEGLHYSVDGQPQLLAVDTVVVCAGQESERTLYEDLLRAGLRPMLIGGADSARELDAVAAIAQGTRTAYEL